MITKLAVRNVKRQIGNYVIYFITVTLTIALMFALHNVVFSQELQQLAETMETLNTGLIMISIAVSLVVAFVLGYATSFMLKLRKREFGTYLTLGMTRGNVLRIFVLETIFMGLTALVSGILAGLLVFQGFMALLAKLIGVEMAFASYSMKGLILTVCLVCGIFVLASVTSAIYLKRVKVYDLIQGEKRTERPSRHPLLWLFVAAASFVIMIYCCVSFQNKLEEMALGKEPSRMLMYYLAGLAISLFFFHMGLARCLIHLLLKSRRYASKDTNTFTLRQLSGKMSSNAAMAGILSFLLAFAVIGANCAFLLKISDEASLEQQIPYDIMAQIQGDSQIGLEEGLDIIGGYVPVEEVITYNIYSNADNYLYKNFTPWTGDAYEVWDVFMRESDFNRLIEGLGYEPVALNGKFQIVTTTPRIMKCDFSKAVLEINGIRCEYGGISNQYPDFGALHFLAVIPDALVEGMVEVNHCAAISIADGQFDAYGLRDDLSFSFVYSIPNDESSSTVVYDYPMERCDFSIREYSRIQRNSMNAVFILGALYMAVIFTFLAMAILALKVLSGISEDKKRYEILYRLGVGAKEQKKTLLHQVFSFFFLPFAVPMLLSIPTTYICDRMMVLFGLLDQRKEIFISGGAIVTLLVVIYILYFIATFVMSKRTVVREEG